MEILKPDLLWINKRCYRLNPYISQPQPTFNQQEHPKEYIEEDLYNEEEENDDRDIVFKNNQFEASIHVPSLFFCHIIGTKGSTKKRIESETATRITVPKPGIQGNIIVVGKSRNNVVAACRKIDLVVVGSRRKLPTTHFISVPTNNPAIKDAFIKFREEIKASGDLINFDESFFVPPDKLHVTIAMLTLVDNEDRLTAAQLLHESTDSIIRPLLKGLNNSVDIHLKGLEIMNDDPSAVGVLYAIVKSEELQKIADNLVEVFAKTNLAQKKNEKVKLHVTLIKSSDDKLNDDTNQRQQQRQTFDARRILETYCNYNFGLQKLEEIHLSQRHSTSSDGYYEATAIVKL